MLNGLSAAIYLIFNIKNKQNLSCKVSKTSKSLASRLQEMLGRREEVPLIEFYCVILLQGLWEVKGWFLWALWKNGGNSIHATWYPSKEKATLKCLHTLTHNCLSSFAINIAQSWGAHDSLRGSKSRNKLSFSKKPWIKGDCLMKVAIRNSQVCSRERGGVKEATG